MRISARILFSDYPKYCQYPYFFAYQAGRPATAGQADDRSSLHSSVYHLISRDYLLLDQLRILICFSKYVTNGGE